MRHVWLGRALLLAIGPLAAAACGAEDGDVASDEDEVNVNVPTNLEAVARAQQWVDVKLQYCWAPNGGDNHAAGNPVCERICRRRAHPQWDPYRSDCSGLVSWSWGLAPPGLTTYAWPPNRDSGVVKAIPAADLRPGDAVNNDHHVMLFKDWIVKGKRAKFLEEPGCGAGMGYAREVANDVTLNGNRITLKGRDSFTAIRYLRLRQVEKNASTEAGAPDAPPPPPEEDSTVDKAAPVTSPMGGVLDRVSCEGGVQGWAVGASSETVNVELSFFGDRDTTQPSQRLRRAANMRRPDLPAEQADNGFVMKVPLSARDGKPHPVFGYAIDDQGNVKQLEGAPTSFSCAPPPFPLSAAQGSRRAVPKGALEKWSRTTLDVARAQSDQVEGYAKGPGFPAKPRAVEADDGFSSIYVVDGQLRRPIDPDALHSWGLRKEQLPATEIAKLRDGPPWPATPFFFQGGDGEVYALDTKVPEAAANALPDSLQPSNELPDEDGNPRSDEVTPEAPKSPRAKAAQQDNAGCGAAGSSTSPRTGGLLLVAMAIAAAAKRRRSNTRA